MVNRRQKVTDAEILATFREHKDPVLTTSEVANSLPVGQRATYNRLQSLAEENQLEKKKVGARGIIWWPTDIEYTYQSAGQQALTQNDTGLLTALNESEENYNEKRAAIMEAFRYLQRNGEASRAEFYEEVYPDYPAGHENRRAWWEKIIRPSFSDASTVTDAPRGGAWIYRED